MTRRVVITGLGAVCGSGHSKDAFWQALRDGRSGIAPLGSGARGSGIVVGAPVQEFEPQQHFKSEQLPLLDRFAQFAVVAAREALADAGLASHSDAVRNAAAIVGTGCGGKQTDEETYLQLYKEGKNRAHPLTIPRGMPSAAAGQVSLLLGVAGPVYAVSSACASAAHAVVQGQMMIQSGLVEVALVGGSDAPFTYGLLKAWEAMRVVSKDTCRPFSKDRSGMVLGEGAGMLVLESESHASRRNARVYAELAGFGLSSDASHITRPDIEGIARAIGSALTHAGLRAEEVNYINAHGTGTLANDVTETAAIRRVFAAHAEALAVSSTKSMHGHALGAASALELIATALSIYHDLLPPTANFTEPGEGCDLDYVPNTAREAPVQAALCNSFAFGGMNAVLALRKFS